MYIYECCKIINLKDTSITFVTIRCEEWSIPIYIPYSLCFRFGLPRSTAPALSPLITYITHLTATPLLCISTSYTPSSSYHRNAPSHLQSRLRPRLWSLSIPRPLRLPPASPPNPRPPGLLRHTSKYRSNKNVTAQDDADYVREHMLLPILDTEQHNVVMIMHSYRQEILNALASNSSAFFHGNPN